MATTSDFRNGLCLEMNNDLMIILEFQRFQTGRGASNVRTKLKSLNTGKIIDHTFTGGEKIETARIETRSHQFLYRDESGMFVMNNETFDQFYIQPELVENNDLLKDGDSLNIVFHAEKELVLYGELPDFVELEVTYTEPGIKGDTATNTLKPATLETGAEIRVPLFVNQGDRIKVDTRKRAYNERVK
ncbi:MAG: elongation factor P [Bacteroidetes bacterium]|jgi:elongation factor P|nr:elongation factor P [Bacteroidota bacterium]